MPNKWQLTALLTIALLAAGVAAVLRSGATGPLLVLQMLSAAVTSTTLTIYLFHAVLWRYLPNAVAPRPNINGTWRVKGKPWNENEEPLPEFEGFMFVKQNYFTMSMCLETRTTRSELEADEFNRKKDGEYEFWAIYRCEPGPSESPATITQHYGAFRLCFASRDRQETELAGRFWIDGSVKHKTGDVRVYGGTLLLQERHKVNYKTYRNASKAYGTSEGR